MPSNCLAVSAPSELTGLSSNTAKRLGVSSFSTLPDENVTHYGGIMNQVVPPIMDASGSSNDGKGTVWPLLDYYAERSSKRWGKFLISLAICVLALLAPAGVHMSRQILEHRHEKAAFRAAWAQQQQWMTFTGRPEQVVYEEDPAAAEKLIAGDAVAYRRNFFEDRNAGFHVHSFTQFCGWENALLFLHERRTPAGNNRIVAVGYQYGNLLVSVQQPNSKGFAVGLSLKSDPLLKTRDELPTNVVRRFFAGQPDPHDPSHFIIRFEVNNQPGVVDGWLLNDNTVKLKARDGPAK